MPDHAPVHQSSTRFHALDALRAWAMSLGIVLHAAWIMIPEDAGAPRVDASAHWSLAYLCLAIHTFRMQLFFLLAGFFAYLLLRKRGMKRFLKNRVLRILLPLTMFWLLFYPLVIYQYNVAGIQSGKLLGNASAAELTRMFLENTGPRQTMLLHLWFLNYLAWIYVVVLLGRSVLSVLDRRQRFRRSITDGFIRLATTRAAPFWLAIPFAIPLFFQRGAWGITITGTSFVPNVTGLIAYLMFFVAGWMIYQRLESLPRIIQSWRWHLLLGVGLTVPFYVYTEIAPDRGYATWKYPELTIEDLRHRERQPDYPNFRKQLLEAASESVPGRLFAALPPEYAAFVETHESASEDQVLGLLTVINRRLLDDPELFGGLVVYPSNSTESIIRSNRLAIEAGFGGTVYPESRTQPYYYLQRAIFAYLFTLTTWSLIFGCIGFSQHHFDRANRFWRYFSDASYWFYLAHLPIQFQLLIWFGDQPWHPLLKFSAYVLLTTGILVPSYHFFIRPTWVGYLLNGRMASVWPKKASPSPAPPTAGARLSETTSLDVR